MFLFKEIFIKVLRVHKNIKRLLFSKKPSCGFLGGWSPDSIKKLSTLSQKCVHSPPIQHVLSIRRTLITFHSEELEEK